MLRVKAVDIDVDGVGEAVVPAVPVNVIELLGVRVSVGV